VSCSLTLTVKDVNRRRIEAASFGNVTVGWGVAEGSAVTPFTTTGMVGAFDNNIHPVTGAIDWGMDWRADSPLDVAAIIANEYGKALRNELDNVIANGNGTDRPLGLFNTAGLTTLNAAGGASSNPQVDDLEALSFGVAKEFRQEAGLRPESSRCMFVGSDTTYSRIRGLNVGSGDARRLFGTDSQMSYRLMGGYNYAVTGAAANTELGFFAMNRYRLYRRAGLEIRFVNNDRTSVLSNTELLAIRARFGGGLDHASAGVQIADLAS